VLGLFAPQQSTAVLQDFFSSTNRSPHASAVRSHLTDNSDDCLEYFYYSLDPVPGTSRGELAAAVGHLNSDGSGSGLLGQIPQVTSCETVRLGRSDNNHVPECCLSSTIASLTMVPCSPFRTFSTAKVLRKSTLTFTTVSCLRVSASTVHPC
jgi:hypothetical protein